MLSRSLFRELKNMLDNIEKIQKNYLAQPPEWSEKDYKMVKFHFINNKNYSVENIHINK